MPFPYPSMVGAARHALGPWLGDAFVETASLMSSWVLFGGFRSNSALFGTDASTLVPASGQDWRVAAGCNAGPAFAPVFT
jgi:hypothetical protein